MGYANLIDVTPVDRQEVFQRIRDFVCKRNGTYDYSTTGIGWTLHDAVYAVNQNTLTNGDYIVVYSAGESGKEAMYYKITYSATSHMSNQAFTYWNNTTHTGSASASANGTCLFQTAVPLSMWIYGDLDMFYVIVQTAATPTYYCCYMGVLEDVFYERDVITISNSITAGSSVQINVTNSNKWFFQIGRYVIIKGSDRMERVQITANNGTDTITVATVAYSHAAGAKISHSFPYVLLRAYNYSLNASGNNEILMGIQGTVPRDIYMLHLVQYLNQWDPVATSGDYLASPNMCYDVTPTNGYVGSFRHMLRISDDATGITNEQVLQTVEGVNYRYFLMATAYRVAFKEV